MPSLIALLAKFLSHLTRTHSTCLKQSPKPYEFPSDIHGANINLIAMARMNVRREWEKCTSLENKIMSLPLTL